jgi:hypothetical protein
MLALLAMAQELAAWARGAIHQRAVKITSVAPDAARTLAGSGLTDRSDDSLRLRLLAMA